MSGIFITVFREISVSQRSSGQVGEGSSVLSTLIPFYVSDSKTHFRSNRKMELVGRYARCTQDSSPGPTSRRQDCETPFKQTPGADMERQGQSGPEAARVARLQPRHRHNGKAEACHVCQARHAKVRARSHVLIG